MKEWNAVTDIYDEKSEYILIFFLMMLLCDEKEGSENSEKKYGDDAILEY